MGRFNYAYVRTLKLDDFGMYADKEDLRAL